MTVKEADEKAKSCKLCQRKRQKEYGWCKRHMPRTTIREVEFITSKGLPPGSFVVNGTDQIGYYNGNTGKTTVFPKSRFITEHNGRVELTDEVKEFIANLIPPSPEEGA